MTSRREGPGVKKAGARGKRREVGVEGKGGSSPFGWPPVMVTADAARYCGFKTTGGLRKAAKDGLVKPMGKRPGSKTLLWDKEELDRFLGRGRMDAGTSSS